MLIQRLPTAGFLCLIAVPMAARADDKPEPPAWTWGPTGIVYLQSKAVQDELKLKPDQVAKVKELITQRRESLGDPAKLKEFAEVAETTITELLQPEQAKRLRQIQLQKQGAYALQNPTVAAELGLSDKQKDTLNALTAKAPPQIVIGKAADNKIQIQRKEEQDRAATMSRMLGVLTAKQKTKWNEMLGKPFRGSVVPAKP